MELIENKVLKVTVPDEVAKEIKGTIHKTKELEKKDDHNTVDSLGC